MKPVVDGDVPATPVASFHHVLVGFAACAGQYRAWRGRSPPFTLSAAFAFGEHLGRLRGGSHVCNGAAARRNQFLPARFLGADIRRSLRRQTLRPFEIIVVDDGSLDETRAVAERARALGLVDMVICHGTRCGRSAAINAAARFASGDLLLTADADTVFEPTAVARIWRSASCGREF
jgi:hypothetical protein